METNLRARQHPSRNRVFAPCQLLILLAVLQVCDGSCLGECVGSADGNRHAYSVLVVPIVRVVR